MVTRIVNTTVTHTLDCYSKVAGTGAPPFTLEDDPPVFLFTLDTTNIIGKDIRRDVWLIEIDNVNAVEMGDKVLIDLGEYGSRFEGRVVGIESTQDTIRLAIKEL